MPPQATAAAGERGGGEMTSEAAADLLCPAFAPPWVREQMERGR